MRFLCFLLGSALLHAAFLALPLSTSTGGAGRSALQPLRVRLLEPGIPKAEAAKGKMPRPPALEAHGPAGGAAGAERPQRDSTTDEAARGQVSRERPQALVHDRAALAVRSPAAPEALGQSRARGKAARTAREPARAGPKPRTRRAPKTESVRARSGAPPAALAVPPALVWRSVAPASARETPDGPGPDRGLTGNVEGSPGEDPGGATALAGLAPDRERSPGPRAITGRGGAAARTPVRYARVVKPRYPRKARTEGWEGTTVLKVRVDRGGRPGLVTVERSSGFELLDRAAVKAMKGWEFHPARNGGGAVASWVEVPVSFRLEEDQP